MQNLSFNHSKKNTLEFKDNLLLEYEQIILSHLSGVQNRKNVNESFVQWRQETKQPCDPKQGTHYQACSDAKSARRDNDNGLMSC